MNCAPATDTSRLGPPSALAILIGLALLGSSPVSARPALSPDRVVSDAELGEIRGKFIRPEQVDFFGISMVTSWQDADGVTTFARLVFNVDFLGTPDGEPLPALMIGWSRDGDPGMDVTSSHDGYTPLLSGEDVLAVGGLGTHNGAAQANVIAGADNDALNQMRITLVPTSQLEGFAGEGLTPVTDSAALQFADGDTLEFRLGANELGLLMTGNAGRDSTMQAVGGDIGTLLQQTVLNSDSNAVLNSSAIVLGADLGGQMDAVRASEALGVMQKYGF